MSCVDLPWVPLLSMASPVSMGKGTVGQRAVMQCSRAKLRSGPCIPPSRHHGQQARPRPQVQGQKLGAALGA